jgi:hypothetical protein
MLSNVVRIVSRDWQLWIKRGGQRNAPQASRGIGFKKPTPRTRDSREEEKTAFPREPQRLNSNAKVPGKAEEGLSAKPREFSGKDRAKS